MKFEIQNYSQTCCFSTNILIKYFQAVWEISGSLALKFYNILTFENKYNIIFQFLNLKSRVKWQKNTLKLFVFAHLCANNVSGLSSNNQVTLREKFTSL